MTTFQFVLLLYPLTKHVIIHQLDVFLVLSFIILLSLGKFFAI